MGKTPSYGSPGLLPDVLSCSPHGVADTVMYAEGWADVGLLGVMIHIELLYPLPPLLVTHV